MNRDRVFVAELRQDVRRRAGIGDIRRRPDVVSTGHAQRRCRGRALCRRPHPVVSVVITTVPVCTANGQNDVSNFCQNFEIAGNKLREWKPRYQLENDENSGRSISFFCVFFSSCIFRAYFQITWFSLGQWVSIFKEPCKIPDCIIVSIIVVSECVVTYPICRLLCSKPQSNGIWQAVGQCLSVSL